MNLIKPMIDYGYRQDLRHFNDLTRLLYKPAGRAGYNRRPVVADTPFNLVINTCQILKVRLNELRSSTRTNELAEARMLIIFMLDQAAVSRNTIARVIYRGHGYVSECIVKHRTRYKIDADYSKKADSLFAALQSLAHQRAAGLQCCTCKRKLTDQDNYGQFRGDTNIICLECYHTINTTKALNEK